MKNIAILASHSGSGLDAIYEAVQNATLKCNIAVVISNNTNAVALQKAEKYGLKNFLVNAANSEDPDERLYSILQANNCEYIFLSGYMKKLSPKITQNFKVINSHPALLPNYGGAGMYGRFVHEAVVRNQEEKSGVTIHEVNENYDEGKIILQKSFLLQKDETPQSLETKIKALEKIAIVEGLQLCLN